MLRQTSARSFFSRKSNYWQRSKCVLSLSETILCFLIIFMLDAALTSQTPVYLKAHLFQTSNFPLSLTFSLPLSLLQHYVFCVYVCIWLRMRTIAFRS